MINAGRLNNRVTIQSRQVGVDAVGQPVDVWVNYVQVWANIKFVSGIDSIMGGAEFSVTKCSVMIRKRSDIKFGMRLLYDGNIFDIVSVRPDEENGDKMYLVCEIVK